MTHSPALLLHFYQKPVVSVWCRCHIIFTYSLPLCTTLWFILSTFHHHITIILQKQVRIKGFSRVFQTFRAIVPKSATQMQKIKSTCNTHLPFIFYKRDVTDTFPYLLCSFIQFYAQKRLLFPTLLHLCLFSSMLHMPDNNPCNGNHHKYGCKCH